MKTAWRDILSEYAIECVYGNKDYEPYARKRDQNIRGILANNDIELKLLKDQVIFEEGEITKDDGLPYTVYTPYKKKWLSRFSVRDIADYPVDAWKNYFQFENKFPTLKDIGFESSLQKVKDFQLDNLDNYSENRNLPAIDHRFCHLPDASIRVFQNILLDKKHLNAMRCFFVLFRYLM